MGKHPDTRAHTHTHTHTHTHEHTPNQQTHCYLYAIQARMLTCTCTTFDSQAHAHYYTHTVWALTKDVRYLGQLGETVTCTISRKHARKKGNQSHAIQRTRGYRYNKVFYAIYFGWVCIHIHVYVCACIPWLCIYVFMSACVCMYEYIYIYIYICTCYTYIACMISCVCKRTRYTCMVDALRAHSFVPHIEL
jgi:hypothetical protein